MTINQIKALYNYRVISARDSFKSFRKLLNPKLKFNWFVDEVCEELEQFYYDFKAGKRPKLILCTPPQHGKSMFVVDLIAWISGKDPDLKTVFASFSERLGIRANLKLQRIYTSKLYNDIFPNLNINSKNVITGVNHLRNREILEYVNKEGYFRNTTVQGSITGESLDIGIIDDPIKGREAANSPTIRDKTWEWLTDDLFTRFSEYACFLMILTRWHIDDPAGRFIEKYPNIKVLNYKAIAEHDEKNRSSGEALLPEHKSVEFLLERKKIMGEANFQSLYQQNPIVQGGNLFNSKWISWVDEDIISTIKFERKFITVDTALKDKQTSDYTVYSLFGIFENKLYWLDMYRGKPRSMQREITATDFYNKHSDYPFNGMFIEQKASGVDLYQRMFDNGFMVFEVERNKDKIYRAETLAPFIEIHKLHISKDIPNKSDLITEYESFPNSTHDDIIDTLMDGIEICYKNLIVDNVWW